MSVELHIDDAQLSASPGLSVFEGAEQVGVRVPTSCKKNGKCRECLVQVESGAELLAPRLAPEGHLKGRFRLACCARVAADSGRLVCRTLRRGELQIESRGEYSGTAHFDPAVTRDGEWVLLDGEPLVKRLGPVYGLAVDVGTTTVVLRLVDLATGMSVASTAFENPQRFGGSDVMARIAFDGEHGGRLLQRTLQGYLGRAIDALPCDSSNIYEVVVAGNTTMRDIFFGLDVSSVGQKPYRSRIENEFLEGQRTTTALSFSAPKLRLPVAREARVYGLPLIGSHLGADTAACLLALDLGNQDRATILMDIGTNTELLVMHRDRIVAASCPAGPAFEGGGIGCGVPALQGAIEGVQLTDAGVPRLSVIGRGEPIGICGSGLIELVAELRRTARLDEYGRFVDESPAFELAPGLRLTEADISELAQAKGANVAGLNIALNHFGCSWNDIDRFVLAGGFGRHLPLAAARTIGLIPDLPDPRLARGGNLAIEGAALALCSASRRRSLEERVLDVEHIELETHPQFFDYFVDGCLFEPFATQPTSKELAS